MKFYRYFPKFLHTAFFVFIMILTVSAQAPNREQKIADFLKNSGNYEQALSLYLKIFHSSKPNYILITNIQDCYEKLKQYPELISFLNDLIRKYPENLEYKIKLGRAYYLDGQADKAFALWDSLLQKYPKNIYLYRSLGANLIQLRLYERAIRVYRAAIEHIPRQKSLYREIALIYRARLDYAEALKNYLNYFKAFPTQYGYIRSQIIAMSSDTSAIWPMIKVLQEYQKDNRDLIGASELLADLYLRSKKFAAAFDVYLSIYKKMRASNYLLRFAHKAADAEAYDFAVKALQILRRDASDQKQRQMFQLELARNYYRWARQLAQAGQEKESFKKIKKAESFADALIKARPASGYRWAAYDLKGDLALKYYQDVDQAIDWYRKVLQTSIDYRYKDRTRLKLSECYLMKGDLPGTLHTLNRIRSAMYTHLVDFKKADLLFYQGKLTPARQAFQALSQKLSPEDSLANNVLERLLLLNRSQSDSTVLVQYGHAELLIRQKKLSEAARVFESLAKKHSSLSAQCGEQAVRLFIKLGKFERAASLIRAIEKEYPDYVNNDRLYFLLATARQKQGQWKEAFVTYQTLITKYPDSFLLEKAREKARYIRKTYLKAQVE